MSEHDAAEPDEQAGGQTDRPAFTMPGTAGNLVQAGRIGGGVHFHVASGGERPAAPHQLPADVRGFVDRQEQFDEIDRIMAETGEDSPRIVLITGTAGVGKTSLALRWAHRAKSGFPDGNLYTNLRGYDPGAPVDPYVVLEGFLTALRVPAGEIPPDIEARSALLRSLIADRRMLFVLDNAASAAQVRPLLPGEGESRVVVTSRGRFPSLISRDGAHWVMLQVLGADDSVRLLQRTTERYRSGDQEADFRELARLCASLPLALRIAAERAAAQPRVSLASLIRRLRDDDIWDALSSGDEDDAAAVRAVFAWSYRALTADAARMFRRLGLHPGSEFGSGAAAALAGVALSEANKLLDGLVRVHMIEQRGEDRFQFHDLLRAYAVDQLQHEDSKEEIRESLRRELDWYLRTGLAATARAHNVLPSVIPDLPESSVRPLQFDSQGEAVAWYDRERQNIAAAARAAAAADLDDFAWQLPVAVYPVSSVLRASFGDILDMSEVGLQAARRKGVKRAEAEILGNISVICLNMNQPKKAEPRIVEAIAIGREIDHLEELARSNNILGWVYIALRQLEKAIVQFEATYESARRLDLKAGAWVAIAQINMAVANFHLERLEVAAELAAQALSAHAGPDADLRLRFDAQRWVARIGAGLGRLDEAEMLLDSADETAELIGGQKDQAIVALDRGRLDLARGRFEESLEHFHLSAGIAHTTADRILEAEANDGTGEAYRRLNRPEDAEAFHRRAAALFEQYSDVWQQAVSLEHLALVLDAQGERESAREQRLRSLALIAPFEDAPATALKSRLRAIMDAD